MANRFIELVQIAIKNNWCVRPHCTTCGSLEFRKELEILGGGTLGGELVNLLSEIDFCELMKVENWDDALIVAILTLPLGIVQIEGLLSNWLQRIDNNIRFADVILFNIIRSLPLHHEMREKWISKCIELCIREKDFSLTESLILVMGKDATKHPLLIELAKLFSKESSQMKRVMVNTGIN